MSPFMFKTPHDVMQELKKRFKDRRLDIGFSQQALSERSGVSLGSLKRFENTGEISLVSLLKIAIILDCLGDFENIANQTISYPETIKDKLKEKKCKRGNKQ